MLLILHSRNPHFADGISPLELVGLVAVTTVVLLALVKFLRSDNKRNKKDHQE